MPCSSWVRRLSLSVLRPDLCLIIDLFVFLLEAADSGEEPAAGVPLPHLDPQGALHLLQPPASGESQEAEESHDAGTDAL